MARLLRRLPFPALWNLRAPSEPTFSTPPASRPGPNRDHLPLDRRRIHVGIAPLSAKGLLGRVRGVSAVPVGRRSALHRLEDRGALRSLGRAPVRGGDEPPRQHRARRQPVDGVERRQMRVGHDRHGRPAHQARVRRAAHGGAGAATPPAARRRRARALRRSHSQRRSRRAPATASGAASSPRSRSPGTGKASSAPRGATPSRAPDQPPRSDRV